MDRFETSEQETLTCPLHLKSVETSRRVRLTSLTLTTLQMLLTCLNLALYATLRIIVGPV